MTIDWNDVSSECHPLGEYIYMPVVDGDVVRLQNFFKLIQEACPCCLNA